MKKNKTVKNGEVRGERTGTYTDEVHGTRAGVLKKCIILFYEFAKIGLFTIGGGMAMIPQIQQVVLDRKWLDEEELLDCLAVSQSLPGVIAINASTYIGKRQAGLAGAAAATLGVVMPSFVIILLAVTLLDSIGENSYVLGAFTGIKAAVCGLILVTAVRLAKQNLKNLFQWIIAAAAFVAIGIFGITAIWVIIAGIIAGVIYNSVVLAKADSVKPVDLKPSSSGEAFSEETEEDV